MLDKVTHAGKLQIRQMIKIIYTMKSTDFLDVTPCKMPAFTIQQTALAFWMGMYMEHFHVPDAKK